MTVEDTGADDIILRHRVAALRKNLDEVKRIRGSVSDRRTELGRLLEFFDQPGGPPRMLRRLQQHIGSAIDDMKALTGDLPPEEQEDYQQQLRAAAGIAERLQLQFADAQAIMRTIGSRWVTLAGFDDHMDRVFNANESAALQRKIENLEAELDGRPVPNPADAEEGTTVWERYQAMLRHSGEELFGEYVDFLGGWALRNTGVAHDVCAIADDLIQRFYWVGSGELWHSMAVPARRDATAWTLARIIRLGFPEWTVWAVPLSAHEFGRVVLRLNASLRDDYLQQWEDERDRRRLETCLADAFATYAIGPAYAYASLLLRLEPSGRDNDRMHVVFKMLDRMTRNEAFVAVREGLEEIWRTSLDQVGIAFDLDQETDETLEGWTEAMAKFLRTEAIKVEYDGDRFEQVTGWPLLTMPELELPSEDVRDLLNAAWHQRMQEPRPSPQQDALATAAIELWRQSAAAKVRGTTWGTTRGRSIR
jgi:hypothetical protein